MSNIRHIDAKNKNDLNKESVIQEMKKANFVFFSGGNPHHLYDSIYINEFSNELTN